MSIILSSQNLCWTVDEHDILQDVSVDFEAGYSYGIIGPNGAGKTSFLKCLQGLIIPDSGTVKLGNTNIANLHQRELAKQLAWLPQTFSAPMALSVYEMVRMGLTPHKSWFQSDSDADKESIKLAMQQCDLQAIQQRPFVSLSGGEQQRVLLARAIVQRAEVFLLDELTSHLDVYFQHQLLSLVKSLKKTIIMTIHDMNLAAQYLDRLVLINKGSIVAVGTPLEVLQADLLQACFGLRCDVSVTSNNLPVVCFSHE